MVQSRLRYSLGCGKSGLRYSQGYGTVWVVASLGRGMSGLKIVWVVAVWVTVVWVKASLGCSSLGYVVLPLGG